MSDRPPMKLRKRGPRKYRPQWWRWSLYLLIVVLALGAGAVIGAWGVGRLSLPDYDGDVTIAGLAAPVFVKRDRFGVPRIEAQTMLDAYRVLGYVHAQDRMFQMEMTRRVGAGRLAEILGERVIGFDKLMRTLGLYRLAEQTVAEMDAGPRAALEAYADGVNAWIAQHPGPLPPEFLVLRFSPDRWQPADSVVWGYLMALQLSDNWRGEIARARLAQRLSLDQLDDLWPPLDPGSPTTLAATFNDYCCEAAGLFDRLAHDLASLDAFGSPFKFASASNEWVLSGLHTQNGAPLLANDPHLGFSAPLLWYLAEILTPELQITGATVPGVPFTLLGHNGRIAWGFTTTHADVQDLFLERPDPADPLRYLTPDGSLPFELRREQIDVRNGETVTITVRVTRHGPVISDVSDDAAAVAGDRELVALAFNALQADNKTSAAIYDLNRARNWPEFVAALENFHSPLQNIVYADIEGHIGFYVPGRLPIRAGGDGTVPVPGWSGDFDWTGFVPFARMPHRLDPPSGRLVNANNRVVANDYPHMVTANWPDGYRARRIDQLLAAMSNATLDDFAILQSDATSLAARELLAVMVPLTAETPSNRAALALLKSWDGRMDRARPEPLIYAAWTDALARLLYDDELGGETFGFGAPQPRVILRMLTDRPAWCDNVMSPASESCAEITGQALASALDDLSAAAGDQIDQWRWGDFHRARFGHQIFGRIPVVRDIFDIVIATDGGDGTINRGTYRRIGDGAEIGFDHVHGAGFRALYDLADLSRSRMIVATGQSGHPLSRHFGDLTARWRDGGYLVPGARIDGADRFPADVQIFSAAGE